MPVVGFSQDPGAPDGAGLFHMDDGRDVYAHDPDLARQVTQPQQSPLQVADLVGPKQDMRFAGPGAAAPDQLSPQQQAELGMMPNQQALDQLSNTTFGVPQKDLDAYNARKAAEAAAAQPRAAGPSRPPGDIIQPSTSTTGGESERDRNVQAYLLDQAKRQAAPRPEAWVPKTRAETVESEGMPYSPEDAALRIQANRDVVAAKTATAAMLQERALNEMASAKAAQPELLQRAAEAQKALDDQHAAYLKDRSDLDQAIQASNANPGSASEWMANKSTLAKIVMVLGQAFGAYASIRSGPAGQPGPNYAQQAINSIMESDIAAQREQAKRGVDNALRRLQLRYHDNDQAEAALRIAQGNVLANVQAMHASANQAQDVQAMNQEMLAQNQQALVAQEQKFQSAAYGKHTVKQDLAHQAATGGGRADPLVLVKKLIDAGMPKEEAWRHVFGSGGGQAQADAINRENVGTFEGQAREFTSPDARKRAEETMPELTGMEQKAAELKKILASGTDDPRLKARAKALAEQLSIAYGPAFSGSKRVNEYEIEAGKNTFGHLGDSILGLPTTDVFGRSRAAIDTVLEHVRARKKELLEGSYRVTPGLGTNEKGQRERQYRYQTAPQGLEDVE